MKPFALLAVLVLIVAARTPAVAEGEGDLLATANLAAWCVVPFDPLKRGPEERAAMLGHLGITRLAYDWREEHVATFDAEIEAMGRHGITISAWWYPGHRQEVLDAARRHGIHPQLWVAGTHEPQPSAPGDPVRVAREAARILPLARDAAAIGSQVALYNHREPWCEDQDNQLAVIERLRQDGVTNVGIVFNFHHWRGPLAGFAALFARMQPHLLAVNVNGMPADTAQYPSVRFVGTDASELAMLRVILASGWRGPIGLLHERPSVDAATSLVCSLAGLAWLRKELDQPGSGGAQPTEAGLLDLVKP